MVQMPLDRHIACLQWFASCADVVAVLCRVVIMSILATIMSFTYATIGLGLSIAKATSMRLTLKIAKLPISLLQTATFGLTLLYAASPVSHTYTAAMQSTMMWYEGSWTCPVT